MQSDKKTNKQFNETPSRQPEQLRSVIDLSIPDDPLPLDQLLVDCRDTLKHQVKTGEAFIFILIQYFAHNVDGRKKEGKMCLRNIYMVHIWLMGCPYPCELQQKLECTFLKVYTHMNMKRA